MSQKIRQIGKWWHKFQYTSTRIRFFLMDFYSFFKIYKTVGFFCQEGIATTKHKMNQNKKQKTRKQNPQPKKNTHKKPPQNKRTNKKPRGILPGTIFSLKFNRYFTCKWVYTCMKYSQSYEDKAGRGFTCFFPKKF